MGHALVGLHMKATLTHRVGESPLGHQGLRCQGIKGIKIKKKVVMKMTMILGCIFFFFQKNEP